MSFSKVLPAAVLETILGRLAVLFLSGAAGDLAIAHEAAAQTLASYDPQTANELRVAAQIISFGLHALEALSQAATPDMPLTKILRLRSGAVSLSREADKAERRLEQLKNARRDANPAQPEPDVVEPNPPRIDEVIALIEATRREVDTRPVSIPPIGSRAHQQQQAARQIAETLKKNQAAYLAAMDAAPRPSPA